MGDSLPGDRARNALAGTRFADVRWTAETGSTNTDAMELARQGGPEGIVVVADHQTAGRGRRGRTWEAPPGASLVASVVLRPRSGDAGATTMCVAVAAAEAVESLTGWAPGLKWPNDLVWPGDGTGTDRKLAGILAEVDWPARSPSTGGWSPPGLGERLIVVAGVGINVDWRGRVPADLADLAVALDEITAPHPPPDREDVLTAFLVALDRTYGSLVARPDGHDVVREAWRCRSATLGRRVRVDLGADDVEGTAVDITDEGHLVVETTDGQRRELAVGDVVHLRPLA